MEFKEFAKKIIRLKLEDIALRERLISESSGRLESGKEVFWKFPEFADRYPVSEIVIENNHSLSFVWDPETLVLCQRLNDG